MTTPEPLDLDAIEAWIWNWHPQQDMRDTINDLIAEVRRLRDKLAGTQAAYREDFAAQDQKIGELIDERDRLDRLYREECRTRGVYMGRFDRLAETVARVERLVAEWQAELDQGRIRDENARYCWNLAATDVRRALDEAKP